MFSFLFLLIRLWAYLVLVLQFFSVSLTWFAALVLRNANRANPAPYTETGQRVHEFGGWFIEWLVSSIRTFLLPIGFLVPGRGYIQRGSHPVLLVHGYGTNWIIWLYFFHRFRQDGIHNVRAVNLAQSGSIQNQAAALGVEIERALQNSGHTQCDIVGHSQGGIVTRTLLLQEEFQKKIRTVICLGTPHQGTNLSFLGVQQSARELDANSPTIQALAAEEKDPRIHSIWSTHDNIIQPPDSAQYQNGNDVCLEYAGHNSLLTSNRSYCLVRDLVTQPMDKQQ